MKRALATILIPLALAGCRVAVFSDPHGKPVIVGSVATDPHFNRIELKPDGSVILDGYGSAVNTRATAAVVEGAVRAFIKP